MLYKSTVESVTFSVLEDLMEMKELKSFSLVGGTALSLKYGHRISVDIDLFSNEKFDLEEVLSALEKKFEKDFVYESSRITFAIFCKIKNIKVDLVFYPHKTIDEIDLIEGIRLYRTKDIAAMKINAILGRAVKKYFFDLDEILKKYKLSEIIAFHKEKYPSQMLLISIPNAITYFADVEESEDPIALNGQTWNTVKKNIQKSVRDFLA